MWDGALGSGLSSDRRQPPFGFLEPRFQLSHGRRRLGDATQASLTVQFGVDLRVRQDRYEGKVACRAAFALRSVSLVCRRVWPSGGAIDAVTTGGRASWTSIGLGGADD